MNPATQQRRKVCMRTVRAFVVLVVGIALYAAVRILIRDEDGVSLEKADRVREFFASAGDFRCPMLVYYTREEVAQHASESDLWLVIEKNVLDVSSFVQHHPGGALILEAAGGDDAAALFAQHHESSTVRLFHKYCIGRLKE